MINLVSNPNFTFCMAPEGGAEAPETLCATKTFNSTVKSLCALYCGGKRANDIVVSRLVRNRRLPQFTVLVYVVWFMKYIGLPLISSLNQV